MANAKSQTPVPELWCAFHTKTGEALYASLDSDRQSAEHQVEHEEDTHGNGSSYRVGRCRIVPLEDAGEIKWNDASGEIAGPIDAVVYSDADVVEDIRCHDLEEVLTLSQRATSLASVDLIAKLVGIDEDDTREVVMDLFFDGLINAATGTPGAVQAFVPTALCKPYLAVTENLRVAARDKVIDDAMAVHLVKGEIMTPRVPTEAEEDEPDTPSPRPGSRRRDELRQQRERTEGKKR